MDIAQTKVGDLMEVYLAPANATLRRLTGVQKFHDAGYYGERVIAASGETWNLDEYNPDNLAWSPVGITTGTEHGRETAAVFWQCAPKTRVAMFKSSGRFKGGYGDYTSEIMDTAFPNIEKLGITAMWTSLSAGGNNKYRDDYGTKMRELPNFCSCMAAGNYSADRYNQMMEIEEVFGIGAFLIQNNRIIYCDAASYDPDAALVDFCGPWNAHYAFKNSNKTGTTAPGSGTSFATPWVCGMICLVNDFFIDKTGKPLTRDMMRQFFIDNCKDIDEDGFDKKSGYGVPVLPDPSEIDIEKYATKDTKPEVPVEPDEPVEEPEMIEFKDKNQIGAWAFPYVEKCVELGIMQGDDNGNFRPKDLITREEMATVAARIIDKIK